MRKMIFKMTWLSVVLLGCSAVHAEISYPGTAPAEAEIRQTNQGLYVLENNLLSAGFQLKDGTLSLRDFVNKKSGEKLRGGSDVFALALKKQVVAKPKVPADLKCDLFSSGFKVRKISVLKKERVCTLTARFKDERSGLIVDWQAELKDGSNYVRQEILLSGTEKCTVYGLELLNLDAKNARQIGKVPGSPVATDSFFGGVEMPVTANTISENKFRSGFSCDLPIGPGVEYHFGSVVGTYPVGQLRRAFNFYLERERAMPSASFLHYNNWYDVVPEEKAFNKIIAIYHKELTVKRGIELDSFVMDDGWDDYKEGLWSFHKQRFPEGFSNVAAQARKSGSNLGVWISPLGGYGGMKERTAHAKTMGLITEDLDLSEPAYYKWYRDKCMSFIRDYHVNYLKWDKAGDGVDPHFMALLRIAQELKEEKPDLYINVTVGTWPSPFWLNHIDCTWRDGSADIAWFGKGDAREKWLTFRDKSCYKLAVKPAPLYPINSLMHCGLVLGRLYQAEKVSTAGTDLRNAARSFFATGANLQELYLSPDMMTEDSWDQLAEAIRWSQRNADVLVDVHWVGGDPAKLDVYGWASWKSGKATLALRNPDDQEKEITIDIAEVLELPQGAARSWILKNAYKDQVSVEPLLKAGQKYSFKLKPLQVLVFDARPAPQNTSSMPSGARVLSSTNAETKRGSYPASHAIDDDPQTIWHTVFHPEAKPHPHEIVIDLGASTALTGISYLPRQDGGIKGVMQDIECHVSENTTTWGDPVVRGRLYGEKMHQYPERRIPFEKVEKGRYLRVRSLAGVTEDPITTAAEIGIFTNVKVDAPALLPLPQKKAICFALYTTQNKVLKLTAQLYPESLPESGEVLLEAKQGGDWKIIGRTTPVLPGWSALFRVENWDMGKTVPYRVRVGEETYEGSIRRDPVDKAQVVAGVFTGNSSYPWGGGRLPKQDIVDHVIAINPDVLVFTGDQVYIHKDHTKHWIQFGETFGDMIRDRPTICIPDDHDVGQPNIWGAGGRKTDRDSKGGYTKPAEYVNMVQRQQTWHLPDPYDPTPVEQGISVYYTRMLVGGVDFAIIEDRKFKSGCFQFKVHEKGLSSRPDHIEKPGYDPKAFDLPGLKLLGDRQLEFLDHWSRNWKGAKMKAVVSQTVFAQTSTHHGPKNTFYYVDFDANGWPQAGRNKALKLMRRCSAFHLCGDQHLASMGQYGIEDWRDAGWWLCVPSISNTYPRRWAPKSPPVKALAGGMPHTGDYLDSMNNKITVHAHTNPRPVTREPVKLNERMPGFGVVRFDKQNRKVTMGCWPRMLAPDAPDSAQYEGWPRTISQSDNDGRKAVAWLPELKISGATDPVVEVIAEDSGDLLYSVRIQGDSYHPRVFAKGTYTIRVGTPETDRWVVRKGIVGKYQQKGAALLLFDLSKASQQATPRMPEPGMKNLESMLQASDRPNIVFVFSDDHAVKAIGAYGSKINKTPNLDRIAKEGVIFNNSFCCNSICGPSRAAILTGKHSHKNGFRSNGSKFDGSQMTFPKLLQKSGYQTAIIGKWHLESDPTGFDHWEILPGQGSYYNPDFYSSKGKKRYTGYCTTVTTDMALDWLKKTDNKKPFLLMCQYKAPHRSFSPELKYLNKYDGIDIPEPATLFDDYSNRDPSLAENTMSINNHFFYDYDLKVRIDVPWATKWERKLKDHEYKRMNKDQRKAWDDYYVPRNKAFVDAAPKGKDLIRWKYQRYIKNYLRCIDSVDESVGRLRAYLKENGLLENTIFIYSSDQGFYLGEHNWYDKRWAFEESIRMPLLLSWPAKIKPGTKVNALVQNIDYAPTLLQAAGIEIPAGIQGESLLPLIKAPQSEWRKNIYYHYYQHGGHGVPRHEAVRGKRYKLIHYYTTKTYDLIDLKTDPNELRDVSENPEYGQVFEMMKKELAGLRGKYEALPIKDYKK